MITLHGDYFADFDEVIEYKDYETDLVLFLDNCKVYQKDYYLITFHYILTIHLYIANINFVKLAEWWKLKRKLN